MQSGPTDVFLPIIANLLLILLIIMAKGLPESVKFFLWDIPLAGEDRSIIAI
jgi:hypothetical protein